MLTCGPAFSYLSRTELCIFLFFSFISLYSEISFLAPMALSVNDKSGGINSCGKKAFVLLACGELVNSHEDLPLPSSHQSYW